MSRLKPNADERYLRQQISYIPEWKCLIICLIRWKYWKKAVTFNRIEAQLFNMGAYDAADTAHEIAVRYWHYVYNVPFLADCGGTGRKT